MRENGLSSRASHFHKQGTKESDSSTTSSQAGTPFGSKSNSNSGAWSGEPSADVDAFNVSAKTGSKVSSEVENRMDSPFASAAEYDDAKRIYNLVSGSMEASARFMDEHLMEWSSSKADLDEQLKQLNDESQSDIKWERKGNKIIPGTIKVTKVMRSTFQKSTTFKTVKKVVVETPFLRTPTLYTSKADDTLSQIDSVKKQENLTEAILKAVEEKLETNKAVRILRGSEKHLGVTDYLRAHC